MCEFDPYVIRFVKDGDVVRPVGGGYSGAVLYKVIRGQQAFFLKVFKRAQNIPKIKESLKIYERLDIKTPKIVDFGDVDGSRNYIVYEFIDGENLKEYTDAEDFDLEEIRKFGVRAGEELLKLKNFQDFDRKLFSDFEISDLVKEAAQGYAAITHCEIVKRYFTDEESTRLKNKLFEYSEVFRGAAPCLIHGDIKRSNVMLNGNGEICFVDLESMQVGFDIMNVKYQITWCLFEGNEQEQEFIKGFFDGLYGGARPADFSKQVVFMAIANFFIEAGHLYERGEVEKLSMYAEKCKKLFEKILPMDLGVLAD